MKISYRTLKSTEYEYKNVSVIYICFKIATQHLQSKLDDRT